MSLTAPPAWLATWQPVRDFRAKANRLPGSATSWWRSIEENVRVGGKATSSHLLALGADFVPRGTWRAFLSAARRQGLVAIAEGDHVHVQYQPAGTFDAALAALLPYLHDPASQVAPGSTNAGGQVL